MEILWAKLGQTVIEVEERLREKREIAYTSSYHQEPSFRMGPNSTSPSPMQNCVQEAKIRLLGLIGEPDYERAGRIEVSNQMQAPMVELNLAALKESALANRPDVKVAAAAVSFAESTIKLER